jgi:hypothetical protein
MTTIDYDATTRTGRDALRSEIRLSWDGGDPWGSAQSALGGACDVLCDHGGDIPASAGYSPGIGPDLESYPAAEYVELTEAGHVSVGDLEYWARVLDRFADLVPEDRRY